MIVESEKGINAFYALLSNNLKQSDFMSEGTRVALTHMMEKRDSENRKVMKLVSEISLPGRME